MSGTVTGIKLQKNNRNRVNIYLDGDFAFGLSRFTAAWLHEGLVLSDEKIEELLDQDKYEKAYQRALKFLEYRERSTVEMLNYLRKLDVSEGLSERIITRLQDSGLVDDERFARIWIENRSEYRPRSRRALSIELRQHGINDQIIEQSLEKIEDPVLAYEAAQKYARRLKDKEWEEFRQKLYGYLGRRGFNYETSKIVIKQVWEERDHPKNVK